MDQRNIEQQEQGQLREDGPDAATEKRRGLLPKFQRFGAYIASYEDFEVNAVGRLVHYVVDSIHQRSYFTWVGPRAAPCCPHLLATPWPHCCTPPRLIAHIVDERQPLRWTAYELAVNT